MSPGLTTERVYKVLKMQIMEGDFRPGDRLDPAKLAERLNASTTPVRDALHQLLGERMVQAQAQHGFQIPVPSEAGLRNLYDWNSDILALLLRGKPTTATVTGPVAPSQTGYPAATAELFDTLALALGNAEHRRAVHQTSERLHRARMAEIEVVRDVADELEALAEAWKLGQLGALRTALVRYHKRRHKMVVAIIANLTDGPQSV